MSTALRIRWHEQVSLTKENGSTEVAGPWARFTLREPRGEIIAAIERLAPPGEDEELLAESVLSAGGTESLSRWYYCVKELGRRGLVRRSLCVADRTLATFVPFGEPLPHAHAPLRSSGATTRHVLSRFAFLRRQGAEMVLESPLAHGRLILHEPTLAAVIGALARPATAADLGQYAPEMSPATIARLIDLLAESQMIETTDVHAAGTSLETWEFHDLLFHSRSRRGRSDAPFGGTYRLAHRSPPPAILRASGPPSSPSGSGSGVQCVDRTAAISLDRPDLQQLQRDDPPFAMVQERRRSMRKYGAKPIRLTQLGEFLFRVARVKEQWSSRLDTPTGEREIEFASRPFPSGGALYELEFYLAIRACEGLSAGLYRYQAAEHELRRVAGPSRHVDALLDEAAASAGMVPASLQVLIVLAARQERIAWKYESIAYALVLKHVGVVYQTMYLAATAMKLAPCALGCGDADLFARASGVDYFAESSVGEFLLGSLGE